MLKVGDSAPEDNAAFAKKFSYPFPLLCDTLRAIGVAYGACDDPSAARDRRIRYLIDEQGKIARVYDQVVAREHPAQVLKDITGD
jgi:thioredoxin-dependent peroxiredoxin